MTTTERRSLNELTIRGESAQLLQMISRLHAPGWKRNSETEDRVRKMGLSVENVFCYSCEENATRPAATVWLQRRKREEFCIENIIPLSQRGLSKDECNSILREFADDLVQPASEGLEIQTQIEQGRILPESYLSFEAVRQLMAFSFAANGGCQHPSDCRAWQEFIAQVHLDGACFDLLLLKQWLAEQGWPEEQRETLTCAYTNSRAMLSTYDEKRLEQCCP